MDRESGHKIFNRLNYERRGKPQTCWGPGDNERFRSRRSRVWPGIHRQPDPGLISQVLPWFDLSQKWIKKWSMVMCLVMIKGSGMNQKALLHHVGWWPLSEGRWAVIWQDLRSCWSCSYLSWPALSGSSQFMPVLASPKLEIPPDRLSSCVMLHYCMVLVPTF